MSFYRCPRFIVAKTVPRGKVISELLSGEPVKHHDVIVTPRNYRLAPRGFANAVGEIIWDTDVFASWEEELLPLLKPAQGRNIQKIRYVALELAA